MCRFIAEQKVCERCGKKIGEPLRVHKVDRNHQPPCPTPNLDDYEVQEVPVSSSKCSKCTLERYAKEDKEKSKGGSSKRR